MGNGLKLGTREKVVQKMSRDGAVEQSLSEGTTRRVSKRIADADFSHPKEEILQDEGRDPSLRKSRMKKRYSREFREDLNRSRQNPESAEFHESVSDTQTDAPTGVFNDLSDGLGAGHAHGSSSAGQTGAGNASGPSGAGNTSESSGSGKERLRTKKGKRLREKSEAANERLSHAQRKQKTKKRLKKER